MVYLNPKCAKCICNTKFGVWCNGSCRRTEERELLVIQDLQKMPRDDSGNIKEHIPYQNTWYV